MKGRIEESLKNERFLKQQFLKNSVLNQGYNPGDFSEYLGGERENGKDIDNWSLDELETMVYQFKKLQHQSDQKAKMIEKLENLELDDHEDFVYNKRIKNEQKAKTIFGSSPKYVIIDGVELTEGGIFTSKSFSYQIVVPTEGCKVVRLDSDFKWLQGSIQTEYPHIPIPPLITL